MKNNSIKRQSSVSPKKKQMNQMISDQAKKEVC